MTLKMNKKTGNYEINFMLLGKRVHRSCKTNDLEQAKKIETTLRKEVIDGVYGFKNRKSIIFKQISQSFLDYSKSHKKSYQDDVYWCKKFDSFFGSMIVQNIKPSDIEGYISKRLRENVKNSTINREFDSLRKMFQLAVNDKIISENPCSFVKKLRVDNIQVRYLTKQEEKALFTAIGDHWIKDVVLMALHTGMRKGEIQNLKWSNIDFKKKIIHVLQTKSGKARNIPLSKKLEKSLMELKRQGEYVFTNPDTKTKYEDFRQFEDFVEKAEIVKFRFHDLRHTFATRLVEKKADLVVVSTLLGHRNIQTTMRYAHAMQEMILKAISIINKY